MGSFWAENITATDILGSLDKTIGAAGLSVFNVKFYGATGNGSTDDTASVLDAWNAAIAAEGGIVFFPMGTYNLASATSSTFVNSTAGNVFLKGCGFGASYLTLPSGVQGFEWSGVLGGGAFDLQFVYATGTGSTANSTILLNTTQSMQFARIVIYKCYIGIEISGGAVNTWIDGCSITGINTFYAGIYVPSATSTFITNTAIGNGSNPRTYTGDGIYLGSVGSPWLSNVLISYCNNGLHIDGGSAGGGNVQAQNVQTNICVVGLLVSPAQEVFNLYFTNLWTTASTTAGVEFSSSGAGAYAITFANLISTNNPVGVLFNTTKVSDVAFVGGELKGNINGPGVKFSAACSNVYMTGVDMSGYSQGLTNHQNYAIYLTASPTNCSVTGCAMQGNTTAAIGGTAAFGTGCRITGNLGYNPVGKILSPPTSTFTSGTSYTNTTGVDCTIYLTTGSGVTVSAIDIGGNATGLTMSASSVLSVFVPANQAILVTSSGGNATGVWFGS